MAAKPFQFKQFMVYHDRVTHKVGTDGVLLGAWVNLWEEDTLILDIGTGSGLIALMLAQRTSRETRIDAVEIEAVDAGQARENVLRSPWRDRISIHHVPVQQFQPDQPYALIVSNPPYFVKSLPPSDERRSLARHTDQLSFEDLLSSVVRLLAKNGRLAVILPYAEALDFLRLAGAHGLFPVRKTGFRSRGSKPVERLLLELAYEGALASGDELVLYSRGNGWSEEYKSLTRDFYINI